MYKIALATIGLLISSVLGIIVFLGLMGGFAGYVNEERFESARYNPTFEIIIFENVEGIDKDIWINLDDDIRVKINPDIAGPKISASPKMSDRAYGAMVFYKASSVTVWVQTEKEKVAWENYIDLSREGKTVGLTQSEFANIELARENPKYSYFENIYQEVLEKFYSANSPQQTEVPLLAFNQLKDSVFGNQVIAVYNPELNLIILNSELFSETHSFYSKEELRFLLFHELGHAWFIQVSQYIQSDYYALVLSESENSPYFLTTRILNMGTINKTNPDDTELIFLWRAVDEDFAESFAYYFLHPEYLFENYPKRFAFFCKFVSDFAPNCSLIHPTP